MGNLIFLVLVKEYEIVQNKVHNIIKSNLGSLRIMYAGGAKITLPQHGRGKFNFSRVSEGVQNCTN